MRLLARQQEVRGLVTVLVITVAVSSSVYGIYAAHRAAWESSEVKNIASPVERLATFIDSRHGALFAQLPLRQSTANRRVYLTLFDFTNFPAWHCLKGDKALTLSLRHQSVPHADTARLRILIDLDHNGTVDFVAEGTRESWNPCVVPQEGDDFREPTTAEQRYFAKVCASVEIRETLNPEAFADHIEWIRSRA